MADGQLSNPTHPTPPRTEEERLTVLRLIRSRRVGAVTFHRLILEHGSAAAALAALPAIARAAGVQDYECCPEGVARAELAAGRSLGARLLFHGDPDYPDLLAATDDAPPVLWMQGNATLLRRPLVAIIGARNASSLGVRMARRLARDLGEAGFCTVSGLARGIDAEVHLATLATGTIAVQAGGVEVIYPQENAGLAADIARQGLRISEQPPGLQPHARHFPLRNRIVAGMARAVLVVEAAARSGSLITARIALDLGREVLAVPGHPFDARSGGCNHLIRDGAALLRDAGDVFEALGTGPNMPDLTRHPARPLTGTAATKLPERDPKIGAPGPEKPARPTVLSETVRLHGMILDRLGPSPLAEDQLMRDLSLSSAALVPELLTLELQGRIQRQPGGLLSRR
ncbi:DNA-processing protein DprA [Rhodobacter sp. 24-YEA-8]|uniref:DNA-processing protein DprA n=1 Tax=Rhodobacter sp. 24-YEA-8 TaxID=1884310 RepID=UPI0008941BD8|nr:DNA-processing protein DprA [Rhodobacter sp. 24-YEA-8]SEB64615.1 DNA processing protein [Rhodobacter sp. 24-YEA-8]